MEAAHRAGPDRGAVEWRSRDRIFGHRYAEFAARTALLPTARLPVGVGPEGRSRHRTGERDPAAPRVQRTRATQGSLAAGRFRALAEPGNSPAAAGRNGRG